MSAAFILDEPLTFAARRRIRKARAPGKKAPPVQRPPHDPFIEAREVREGIAETIALERARGAQFIGGQPWRRVDALTFLLGKAKITRAQFQAGDTYGVQFRKVYDRLRVQPSWQTDLCRIHRDASSP